MAMKVAAEIVDLLLLGVGSGRRQLQDAPVLGDVWARLAEDPGNPQDMLITPVWEQPAGDVARLVASSEGVDGGRPRKVAYLQDLVVACLTLDDLAAIVIPATRWWDEIERAWGTGQRSDGTVREWIEEELAATLRAEPPGDQVQVRTNAEPPRSVVQKVARIGLLLGVLRAAAQATGDERAPITMAEAEGALGRDTIVEKGVEAVRLMIDRYRWFAEGPFTQGEGPFEQGMVFQVSLNRAAALAGAAPSIAAIKADAARSLFSIECKDIRWAVVDSGIDGQHPAFWDHEKILKEGAPTDGRPQPDRIKETFDFRRIRDIMSVDATDHDSLAEEIDPEVDLDLATIKSTIEELARDRQEGKPVNWAKVRPLIRRPLPRQPALAHGTHVAGILGARWLDGDVQAPPQNRPVKMEGVCPDITLYDFRVIGANAANSEFAVIAALQFIRHLNEQSGYQLIHGVNMSLSIPHNVRNYACGRTQVCVEADALVAGGVVVVAAAGNRGFQQYRLADNTLFESYAASSITDPGNAEGVITVGATHRELPHAYGVSFFSSRGPTGDGRPKPDLLAPGERIESCVPDSRSDYMDGTSMAAPHVSGAAALLMARHRELVGQPARVKQILCDSATDLGRERSFQGHGLVDVLRAIQSI